MCVLESAVFSLSAIPAARLIATPFDQAGLP